MQEKSHNLLQKYLQSLFHEIIFILSKIDLYLFNVTKPGTGRSHGRQFTTKILHVKLEIKNCSFERETIFLSLKNARKNYLG